MAQGRKCESLGLGILRSTSFGRIKRVTLSNTSAVTDVDFISTRPTKRFCSIMYHKSDLEALPQDMLIKIVCGVDHDDLKSLFHVSTSIRKAALIAKEMHFEYNTPKRTLGFQSVVDMAEFGDDTIEEVEAPNAPRASKIAKSLLSRKKLADISVALFDSNGKENWPRRELLCRGEERSRSKNRVWKSYVKQRA